MIHFSQTGQPTKSKQYRHVTVSNYGDRGPSQEWGTAYPHRVDNRNGMVLNIGAGGFPDKSNQ